ncbi:hypothetical protein A2U01_0084831, partial [Trifolium medium]|nr:hypothetical protein [Trifolium medium]
AELDWENHDSILHNCDREKAETMMPELNPEPD